MSDEPDRRRSRRAVLAAGLALAGLGGAALVETGTVPGRASVDRLFGLRPPSAPAPTELPGPTRSGAFVSAARDGARTGWAVSWPTEQLVGAPLPVLVVLHGFGSDHRTALDDLHLDRHLTAVVAKGTRPFALVSVDGGNGYWHRRTGFGDSGAMVSDELLPRLAAMGLRTASFGLLGWSMGGYGALLLGERLGPSRVPVLVAESPAIWTSVHRRNPAAFDSEADYRAHDVWGGRRELGRTAVRIDCGTDDAFCPAVRRFVRGLDPRPEGSFTSGAHDNDFWGRMAPAQLRFVGARLPTA